MKYALISQRQMIEIESAFETKRLFATVKDIETIDKALKILHLLKFSDAVEITGAELAKPEQASTEPPDYVEPPTSDYHNGWEEGFEAAKNLYPKKTKREWYGLSDKDCDKAWEHAQKSSPYGVTRIEVFAKDIEKILKERNGGS